MTNKSSILIIPVATVTVLAIALGACLALPAKAQQQAPISSATTTLSVPKPLTDIINNFSSSNPKFSQIPLVNELLNSALKNAGSTGQVNVPTNLNQLNVNSSIKGANDWFSATFGVSLTKVLNIVGGLLIWALETAIGLIKSGLTLISGK